MDDFEPANQNISFASLTRNPLREHAEETLVDTLATLEVDGIPSSMLAELLFDYTLVEMTPDKPIDRENAITWYAQLTRFRDTLEKTLDEIHQVYEEHPCR